MPNFITRLKGFVNRTLPHLKRHSIQVYIVVGLVVVVAIASRFGKKTPIVENNLTRVSVVTASTLLKSGSVIAATGAVESSEQADLRSLANGQVARVNVGVGSKVYRGQVLASLVNSDLQAQRAQAEAALKAQQANLNQLIAGAKTEDVRLAEAQVEAAQKSLTETKNQQATAVNNAHLALLNAGLAAKPATTNLSSNNPTISGTYAGPEEGEYKISLYSSGNGLNATYSGLESGSFFIKAGNAQPLGTKGLFITFSISGTVNPNDSWTITVPNTESALYLTASNAYQATLQASDATIQGAENALDLAQKTLDLKKSAATNSQIQAAEAAVDQANASVALMNAQIAKTVFVSPINGIVSSIPVKYGELVTTGQKVATVVNNGGIQVKVFVSQEDLARIAIKDLVDIGETAKGMVTNIAPSVDPQTKTAEVGISIDNAATTTLTIGQNISVKIYTGAGIAGQTDQFVLPIQMVKIAADKSASVFTIDANGLVTEKPVILGTIDGESAVVTSGLTADMRLAATVYGLNNGQKVDVQ